MTKMLRGFCELLTIYWKDFMETFKNNVAEKLSAVRD